MTQFETNLANMRANLDAEQRQFEQERWAEVSTTVLSAYRKEQEETCSEGIKALQEQRDRAIASKEDQLRAEMRADVERKFGVARQKLEELRVLFSGNTGSE